jgi:hypothetical protein
LTSVSKPFLPLFVNFVLAPIQVKPKQIGQESILNSQIEQAMAYIWNQYDRGHSEVNLVQISTVKGI